METLFFTGTLIATTIHHVLWTMPPSAQQQANEKYWERQVKIWVKQPTWLQVEQAMASIMKIDNRTGKRGKAK